MCPNLISSTSYSYISFLYCVLLSTPSLSISFLLYFLCRPFKPWGLLSSCLSFFLFFISLCPSFSFPFFSSSFFVYLFPSLFPTLYPFFSPLFPFVFHPVPFHLSFILALLPLFIPCVFSFFVSFFLVLLPLVFPYFFPSYLLSSSVGFSRFHI